MDAEKIRKELEELELDYVQGKRSIDRNTWILLLRLFRFLLSWYEEWKEEEI